MLRALIDAGMDVARLNFSHGTHAEHRALFDGVRAAAEAARRVVAVLADLQGPKIRLGTFRGGPVRLEPGAEAVFTFKVANIGDFDDEFRFSTVLPSGWTAVLVANSTTVSPVDLARVALASDVESNLQFRVQSPEGVLRGSIQKIPLAVISTSDGNQRGEFVATARIADPLGLGGIQRYIVWIIVLGIALVVVVILVDHAKSRRFRGHIR